MRQEELDGNKNFLQMHRSWRVKEKEKRASGNLLRTRCAQKPRATCDTRSITCGPLACAAWRHMSRASAAHVPGVIWAVAVGMCRGGEAGKALLEDSVKRGQVTVESSDGVDYCTFPSITRRAGMCNARA